MNPERYSRQTLFKPIGKHGQEKLKQSRVLVVGAGALGTSISEMLVRAGVGHLTIIDRDYVDWSNLQRQHLYTENDAKHHLPKAIAAERRLKEVNSEVFVRGVIADLDHLMIEEQCQAVDLIIDATDNFETRMLINDSAQKYKVPWIYGGCVGSTGVTFTFVPDQTPCLACLLEAMPLGGETCDTVGIISPTVQYVTTHQATEALKLLVQDNSSLRTTLLFFDLWNNEQSAIDVSSMKKTNCPSCGEAPSYPYLKGEQQTKTAILCGRDSVQIRPPRPVKLNLEALAERLSVLKGKIKANPYLINFEIDGYRLVIFQDGRTLVHGTKDIALSKTLYNRYVGG
ncbi:molybdopterin/thiamine biosynthesis adenylyltransferase [Pullulanibacillus pueri]|uniref:Thiazole biosynthesis adenylyltransferase ThiF n=1 Tax=Pullulanibacillus pueri TaxID=1437324 RepID=A0A8J2ZTT7_9BACL|nr:ThiF family adenylyltransferase [Pullulanibacillus pueri]MBM7681280.1 molybdopterin/thiamine biosynthesis adenylyltransferase [Pullulanibacillus pueri]GGH77763.1 thiazole biosynthesis adenylyltransferase ThiF [Pullulanibacillus pueri]